jgi:hypothetical protein
LLTAAVSSGVDGPPASGASTIGTASRSRSNSCLNDVTHRSTRSSRKVREDMQPTISPAHRQDWELIAHRQILGLQDTIARTHGGVGLTLEAFS